MGWNARITVISTCCDYEYISTGYKHSLKAMYIDRCPCDIMKLTVKGEVSGGYGFPTRLFAKDHEGRVILDVRFNDGFKSWLCDDDDKLCDEYVFNEASFVVTDKDIKFIRVYSLSDNFCQCDKLICECPFTPNTRAGSPLTVQALKEGKDDYVCQCEKNFCDCPFTPNVDNPSAE